MRNFVPDTAALIVKKMEDASDGEGGVFQDVDEVLASLGDVLHAFSNLPYGVVRGVIDEGK